MSDARTSLKASLKWIAIGFGGLLLAAVAVLLLFIYQADALLEQKLAELRAAGEPTTIADLEPEPIGPEQNADAFVLRAEPEVAAIETEVEAAEKTMSPTQQEAFDDLRSIKGIEQSLRSILAGHPGVARLLRQASLQPTFQPDANYRESQQELLDVLGPRMSSLRAAFRVLHYQAMVQLADGQREEALETCLVMFRLARLFDGVPSDVGHRAALAAWAVAIATTNEVLRRGTLAQSAHIELERELAQQDLPRAFRHSLSSDRPFGLEVLLSSSAASPWFGWQARWMPWAIKQETCDYLDLVEVAIATPPLPYHEWQRAVAAESGRAWSYTEMMALSIRQEYETTIRTLALVRALRVLNALAATGATETKSTPTAAALGLSDEAMTDPFNEQPLVIKRLPAGWVIYSVGSDLKDDGGRFTRGVQSFYPGRIIISCPLDGSMGTTPPKPEDVGIGP
jgi:hypothetical protein